MTTAWTRHETRVTSLEQQVAAALAASKRRLAEQKTELREAVEEIKDRIEGLKADRA